MAITDQTPFAIGSDGKIRGVIDGRTYTGPVMTGSAADAAYHQILGAMLEADAIGDFYAGGVRSMIARVKLLRAPGMRELVRQTVREFVCGDVYLGKDADFDAVFAGRGWEPVAVALEAWQAQDFFLLPGMTPGKVRLQEEKRAAG
jgi:hypothetical protein